jgi:hypothetical protein
LLKKSCHEGREEGKGKREEFRVFVRVSILGTEWLKNKYFNSLAPKTRHFFEIKKAENLISTRSWFYSASSK